METRESTLHDCMNKFRIAGRELFNNHFRVAPGTPNAWDLEESFGTIEQLLFEKLVLEPLSLPNVHLGYRYEAYPDIRVQLTANASPDGENGHNGTPIGPILLNREIDSGYWDHPLYEFSNEATLLFICFFDWDQLGYRDNRYVRVLVSDWPSHPEVIGKEALVESYLVEYVLND